MADRGRTGRLRVGIIGVGAWGTRAHLPALAARDDVEVVALADPLPEVLQAAGDRFGVAARYADGAALLADAGALGLGAVVLAVPTDTHHAVGLAALRAGLHVLCEKPLAFNLAQAGDLARAAAEAGVMTRMGFLFRFSPVVARMKELVDAGYIGDLHSFESVTVNAQFFDPQKPRHWKMERRRANGGVFVEYGSHSIDLALWFGGPIRRVVAHGLTQIAARPGASGDTVAVDADDMAAWVGEYATGAQALFRTGWASLPVGGGGLRIYGSRGSLAWQLDPTGRRTERLLAATAEQPEPHEVFAFTPPYDEALDGGPWPIGLLARYNERLVGGFIEDIHAGRQRGPSFADGLAAQAVLEAVGASLAEGRWVTVPEPAEPAPVRQASGAG